MEEMKTQRSEFEALRVQRFLLGLIFVLATLYVALEYTQHEADSYSDELSEEELNDTELAAVDIPDDMMVIPPKPAPPAADQLNVVDEAQTQQDEQEKLNDGMEGDTEDAEPQEAEEPEELPKDSKDNPLNFRIAQELPEFPGGPVNFMKWLTKNLHYPIAAQRQGIEGKVITQFIVESDGTITDLKVIQSLSPICDREALRVLKMMPKWKPGQQNEKPCRSMVCIPIVFKL